MPGTAFGRAGAGSPAVRSASAFAGGRSRTPNQLDILKYSATNTDRNTTVRCWCRCGIRPSSREGCRSSRPTRTFLGSGPNRPRTGPSSLPTSPVGTGVEPPDSSAGPYPLLIVSHGYPGRVCAHQPDGEPGVQRLRGGRDLAHRFHPRRRDHVLSTMLNRPLDIDFVLKSRWENWARRAATSSPASSTPDTGLLGYSMGGYGALIAAQAPPPHRLLGRARREPELPCGEPGVRRLLDPRVKAIVPLAPWAADTASGTRPGWPGSRSPRCSSWWATRTRRHPTPASSSSSRTPWTPTATGSCSRFTVRSRPTRRRRSPSRAQREYVHYQEPHWTTPRRTTSTSTSSPHLGLHLKGQDYASYLDVVESSDASNDYDNPRLPRRHLEGLQDVVHRVGMEMEAPASVDVERPEAERGRPPTVGDPFAANGILPRGACVWRSFDAPMGSSRRTSPRATKSGARREETAPARARGRTTGKVQGDEALDGDGPGLRGGRAAVTQWLVPVAMQGLLSGLLLGLSHPHDLLAARRTTVQNTLSSLNTAHLEQLEGERRYRALFRRLRDAILVYRLEGDGRPGQLVEVNEAACWVWATHAAGCWRCPPTSTPREARRHVQSRPGFSRPCLTFETVSITSDRQRLPVRTALAGADRRTPAVPDREPQRRRAQGAGGVPADPLRRR